MPAPIAGLVPTSCTVLVIGGGPGGSYAAAALARENIDVVVLEADVFPRYHIGESMIPSARYFLRFIDLEKAFDDHGFARKPGAAFKMRLDVAEGYTDFVEFSEKNSVWNVVRSESDELLFRHAGKCGAKIYDGVKVDSINFAPSEHSTEPDLGRPVSASYKIKSTGECGDIKFTYLVDASGRAGVLSTKYLKNRKYNKGLKNIANWAYFKDTAVYKPGTSRQNAPFFEALHDESGWAWMIPLHNGTTSVGVVMNQDLATAKRKSYNSAKEFFFASLNLTSMLSDFVFSGECVTEVKSASDFSYSSSSYAIPYARIVGDAGCFIDPFFSSGVHLAFTSGLSAAVTICASLRGDCDEITAAKWHSTKVTDGYERFKLVVLSAYRQMRDQKHDILIDEDKDNLDAAFALLGPVIQGGADTHGKVTRAHVERALDFCTNAFSPVEAKERDSVLNKLSSVKSSPMDHLAVESFNDKLAARDAQLNEEEVQVLQHIQALRVLQMQNYFNLDSFTTGMLNGLVPRLEGGSLGLMVPVA